MRKIIVTEFMSLDGVVEAPGGNETPHPHAGWQANYQSEAVERYKVNELANVEALLLGRITYDDFAAYWPTQTGEAFAGPINRLPKYVVSRTLGQTSWHNSHILRDIEDVAALKATTGGDMLVYGSATLAKSLLHQNLVDELRLIIYPVSLGGGLRIFDESLTLHQFELKDARVVEQGIIIAEYTALV